MTGEPTDHESIWERISLADGREPLWFKGAVIFLALLALAVTVYIGLVNPPTF